MCAFSRKAVAYGLWCAVRRYSLFGRYAVLRCRCRSGTRYVTLRGLTGSRRVPSGSGTDID
eukprot:5746109-Prymnesium_polylepis.1